MMSIDLVDLAVIGGGPAGMSAASAAASIGLSAALIDDQSAPGGQIYRNFKACPPDFRKVLGASYCEGGERIDRFERSTATYIDLATVWNIDGDRRITYSRDGVSRQIRARKIVIGTGSMERPVPIPGWTLPGVLTVGGLQTLLKASAIAPQERFALAGSGPLLLLLLSQYLPLGIRPAAVVLTAPAGSGLHALRSLPGAMGAPSQMMLGLQLLFRLQMSGVQVVKNARDLRIHGRRRVEALTCLSDRGECRFDLDLVALHEGVVPNLQLPRLVNAEHRWHEKRRCFEPMLDAWGRSSIEGIFIAGDGGGIEGAGSAAARGVLAAAAAAFDLGRIDRDQRGAIAAEAMAIRRRHARARRFLDTLFPPPEIDRLISGPNTIVCRCENVRVAQIAAAIRDGSSGPNQVKAHTRCGMGPCQGRMCGLSLTCIIAELTGMPPNEVGYLRVRAPAVPVTLDELASLDC